MEYENIAYLFWFFFGVFGAYKFYLGKVVNGIKKLIFNN
jgi:TM2 domain-containing membrane protein YozV